MPRTSLCRTLSIIVATACIAACAGTPSHPDAAATAKSKALASQANCSMVTGSHIPPKAGQCNTSPGRSISGEDIDRTGQTNVGDALKMLDPSITVHH